MRAFLFVRCLLLAASCLVVTPPVRAETATQADKTGARAAASEGKRAFDAGQFTEAIDYLRRAESLFHATSHQLLMARAHVELKEWVEARELLLSIVNEPLPERANAVQESTLAEARELLAELEPKIPHVVVRVTGAPLEETTVTLDGRELPRSLYGIAQPVNPGRHELRATAPSKEAVRESFELAESERKEYELALRGVAPAGALSSSSATSAVVDEGGSGGSGLQIGAYSAFGVAAVGAVAGTIFLVTAAGTSSDADRAASGCREGRDETLLCSSSVAAEIQRLDREAAEQQTWAVVGYAVGGAALATGVVLFLLGQSSEEKERASASVEPWFSWGSVGLRGAF